MSANREQVIDELWPDTDPAGAVNNLNQSLFLLRREIDPWYEDDVSVDYVRLQGDLVWLDPQLVQADSVTFMNAANGAEAAPLDRLARLICSYRSPFAPEFEYDDWAIGWRSRVHSTFLDVANTVIGRLVTAFEFAPARDIASHVLQVDPGATDVERRLVWLYAKLGRMSAARAQYGHLAVVEAADGFKTPTFDRLVDGTIEHAG
jgi:DNA-binding SARP family transcriptional activator